MKKADIIRVLGSAAEVARFFGISDAAVSDWNDDADIPELRQLQLEKRRPDLYAMATKPDAAAHLLTRKAG